MLHECNRVWENYNTIIKKDINMYNTRRLRLKLPVLPENFAKEAIIAATDLIKNEPNIPDIPEPCIIIGDLQGNILDMIRYLKVFKQKTDHNILFLGNLIGHGSFSYEVVLLFIILKNLYPKRVYCIRGSNEFENRINNTNIEPSIQSLYGSLECLNLILESFSYFPLCAVVAEKCFCVHGGIGPQIRSVHLINSVKRPIVHEDDFITELIFSDPIDTIPLFMPSLSNDGYLFGETAFETFKDSNGIQLLIRSHTFIPEGIKEMFKGSLTTVYSASPDKIEHKQVGILIATKESNEHITFPNHLPLLRYDTTFMDMDTVTEWKPPYLGNSKLPKLKPSNTLLPTKNNRNLLLLSSLNKISDQRVSPHIVPKRKEFRYKTYNATLGI